MTKKESEIKCSLSGPDGKIEWAGTLGDLKRLARDLKRARVKKPNEKGTKMPYKIGDRVGAIISADKDEARMFGYGTYQGCEIPPPGISGRLEEMNRLGVGNPKILLDNGEVVWGCECWWGPEEQIRQSVGVRPIKIVTPAEYRAPRHDPRRTT